jgi:hypothetical protein
MGRSSPLVADAILWGRASRPAGLAPEAFRSVGAPARVFTKDPPACGVLVSAGIGDIPAGLGGATRTTLASSTFGAP